jgi:hypothetical protein
MRKANCASLPPSKEVPTLRFEGREENKELARPREFGFYKKGPKILRTKARSNNMLPQCITQYLCEGKDFLLLESPSHNLNSNVRAVIKLSIIYRQHQQVLTG